MDRIGTDDKTKVVGLYIATRKGKVEYRRYCIVCIFLID